MLFENFVVNENTKWYDLLDFVMENYEGLKEAEVDVRVQNNNLYVGFMNIEVKFSKQDFLIIQDSMGNWRMSLENENAKVFCR